MTDIDDTLDTLAEALEDANVGLAGCSPTSGGSDGRWCVGHLDSRWVEAENRCELTRVIENALLAYRARKS